MNDLNTILSIYYGVVVCSTAIGIMLGIAGYIENKPLKMMLFGQRINNNGFFHQIATGIIFGFTSGVLSPLTPIFVVTGALKITYDRYWYY